MSDAQWVCGECAPKVYFDSESDFGRHMGARHAGTWWAQTKELWKLREGYEERGRIITRMGEMRVRIETALAETKAELRQEQAMHMQTLDDLNKREAARVALAFELEELKARAAILEALVKAGPAGITITRGPNGEAIITPKEDA